VVRRCDGGGLVPHRRAGQRPASRPEPICRGQAQDGHGKSGARPESRGGSPMAALAPIGHLQLPQHERECHASSGANVSSIKRDSTSGAIRGHQGPSEAIRSRDNFLYGFKGAPAARQPSGLRPDRPRGIAKPRGERVDLDRDDRQSQGGDGRGRALLRGGFRPRPAVR